MHAPDAPRPFIHGLLPRQGYLLALIVLLSSLVLVIAAWNAAREREMRAAEAEFVASADELAARMQQSLINYELIARGGAALFASVARPTPQQWRAYVDNLDLHRRFSSMLGLGFAGYVDSGRMSRLQLEWREAGYGILEVRPHGIREFYGPILYLEPRTPENIAAIGFDMYSEPVRQAALKRALEQGRAQLSGAVHLIQDVGARSTGMLLYLPVFSGGQTPPTLAARRLAMQGWVYVPFRVEHFVDNAVGTSPMQFRIHDITEGSDALLFSTRGPATTPAFTHSTTFEHYGRRWRIDFDSPPLEQAVPRLSNLNSMLALGLFVSLLLYAVTWALARTEARAQLIAGRMTEEYARSEQRFRAAMQFSAIGQAMLDGEGQIVEANPSLGTLVGRTPASLIGVRFEALFEDDGLVAETEDVPASDVPASNDVHRVTRRLHREGDAPRHAHLTYAPVPGHIGQDFRRLVQVEDVTERMRAEARVHALNRTLEARVTLRTRELSQANQELEAFAYSISHDLRAPLRAMDGFSRLLVDRYNAALDESGRDYLARVRKAATRMGELIEALLKMSRLSRGELKLELVDLSQLAVDVLDELRAGEPGRDVEVQIEPGLEVVGDATLLSNLMANLLANAWKFTNGRDDARIEFGAAPGRDNEFFVRDNGAGFPQEYVDKLFRPFQRLHRHDEFTGHGIGLASVKRIIDRHGGTIRANGSPGQGATFYFSLPRELAEAQ